MYQMRNSKDHFKKKILIIGASSYIGSNIASYLSKKNYNVIGSYKKNKPKNIYNYKLIKLDLTSKVSISKIPKDIKIIINCACISKKYYNNLNKIINNNILSSYLLVNFINKELNIEKLIFTSSMSVYGYPDTKNISKDTNIYAPTVYGSIKFLEEKIYISNAKKYSVFCLRLPGILDNKSKYSLIPRLYKNLSKNQLIKISNPYEKYNNILSVFDLSKFINILCNSKIKKFSIETFPISAINPISLIDIVNLIKINLNSSSKIKITNSNDICRHINNKFIQKKYKFKTKTVRQTLSEYLKNKIK